MFLYMILKLHFVPAQVLLDFTLDEILVLVEISFWYHDLKTKFIRHRKLQIVWSEVSGACVSS